MLQYVVHYDCVVQRVGHARHRLNRHTPAFLGNGRQYCRIKNISTVNSTPGRQPGDSVLKPRAPPRPHVENVECASARRLLGVVAQRVKYLRRTDVVSTDWTEGPTKPRRHRQRWFCLHAPPRPSQRFALVEIARTLTPVRSKLSEVPRRALEHVMERQRLDSEPPPYAPATSRWCTPPQIVHVQRRRTVPSTPVRSTSAQCCLRWRGDCT